MADKISEPMIEQMRPSHLTDAVQIASPDVPRRTQEKLVDPAQPVSLPRRQPLISSHESTPIRRSQLRMPDLPTMDIKQAKRSPIAEPVSVPFMRPSRITDSTQPIEGGTIKQTRLSPSLEIPSMEGLRSVHEPIRTETAQFRMRDRKPLLFGVDPTQAIAASRIARIEKEKQVEERRKTLGIRGTMTYSQLRGG